MLTGWFRRIWATLRPRSERDAAPDPAPSALPVPDWEALIDASRKSARAVLRLDTRLDSLEHQVVASSAAVRTLLARVQSLDDAFWAPLMDAIDRLDAARDAVASGQVEGASEGLSSIGGRLERLLAAAGYQRHGARGIPVDGRLHRVVGTLPLASEPEGSVARVVRAPVTRGETVVRTGEVLAVKHSDNERSPAA